MTTAHTSGPWALLDAEPGVPYLRIRGTQLGGRYKVANVHAPSFYPNLRELTMHEEAETFANARLITAAPELLASLVQARKALAAAIRANWEDSTDEDVATHMTIRAMDAAIAKATGVAR